MRPIIAARSLAAVIAIAGPAAACHKSAETEAAEAKQATEVKVQKEQKAFCELEHGANQEAARALVESQEADENAAHEQADVAEAVARERDRYTALLTKELAWLDRRIAMLEKDAASAQGALKTEKDQDVTAARAWGDHLRQDLDAVQHPTPETDWTTIKMRVDRDLDENRPVSIPRTFEKSYGI